MASYESMSATYALFPFYLFQSRTVTRMVEFPFSSQAHFRKIYIGYLNEEKDCRALRRGKLNSQECRIVSNGVHMTGWCDV